mmetsp:Transcript_71166/g.170442  ORF Transcript_71166/g.170442 Transcript_71166/m.170442 type:complete len:385 (+) Transcript_71166:53-1207(+)
MEMMGETVPAAQEAEAKELVEEGILEGEEAHLQAPFGDPMPFLQIVGAGCLSSSKNSKSAQRGSLAGIMAIGAAASGRPGSCSVAWAGPQIAAVLSKNCGNCAQYTGLVGLGVAAIAVTSYCIVQKCKQYSCCLCGELLTPQRQRLQCSEGSHLLCAACLDAHASEAGDGGDLRCLGGACRGHFPAAAVVRHLSLPGSRHYAGAPFRVGAAEVMQRRNFQRFIAEQAADDRAAADYHHPADFGAPAELVTCMDCGRLAPRSIRCSEDRHSLCKECVNVRVQEAVRAGPNAEPARFQGVNIFCAICRREGWHCCGYLRVSDGLLQQLMPETLPLYLEALRESGRRYGRDVEETEEERRRVQQAWQAWRLFAQERRRERMIMGAQV